MAQGYSVVPQSLDDAARYFGAGSQDLTDAKKFVDASTALAQSALGVIGRRTNFSSAYQRAREAMSQLFGDGATDLRTAANQLTASARWYRAQEADYYKKFGYLDDSAHPVKPVTITRDKPKHPVPGTPQPADGVFEPAPPENQTPEPQRPGPSPSVPQLGPHQRGPR